MDAKTHIEHEYEHDDDLSCLEVISETLSDKEGIVNICVDTNQETVAFY